MPTDFKAKLDQFLNSLIAKGVTPAEIATTKAAIEANPALLQGVAEGVLAQDELSRRSAMIDTETARLRGNQAQWTAYMERANKTLSEAEQARLEASNARAAAETAIKALAVQYNIPEDEVRALYSPSTTGTTVTPPSSVRTNPNPEFDPARRSTQATANAATREDLLGLIEDMGKKDAINARHFALTGRPWDSSKAINYIKDQATLGREINIEDAWRITEGIDAIEATKALELKTAERASIEQEIREKIAAENSNPLDAQPQFGEAVISKIFETSAENQDPNAKKETTGHYGRTREAVAALNRLQSARRLGQPNPYETTNSR